MLPAAAVFHLPWEISSGSVPEGESVRTFVKDQTVVDALSRTVCSEVSLYTITPPDAAATDKLCEHLYNVWKQDHPEESRATLSAQHTSKEHQVLIHTVFVEPFNPIIGAQYIALGEMENAEGTGLMLRARVLNCVDGVNTALLQKAIHEQRAFFRERESEQRKDAQPADATGSGLSSQQVS